MLGLRVVEQEEVSGLRELLISAGKTVLRVPIEERDIAVPLISLRLREFYALTDQVVDTHGPSGVQMVAALSYIWQGKKRELRGAVVPLSGTLLAVPFGFFDRRH